MAIDEQQKDILRKRLELARASKVAKKQKITDVVQAPTSKPIEEPCESKVEEAPIKKKEEPKIVNDISLAKVKEIPLVKEIPSEEPLPTKRLAKKETKEKYAKLVFYKEPSGKSVSRLSRMINDEDSDDADKAIPQTPKLAPQQQPLAPLAPKPDPRLIRQQQISNMAKRFFDGN
jgi:hypothetical protein